MIDLFALIRLAPGETIERVYRSHPLRLLWQLAVAASILAFPFFFLFDFSGQTWALAIACWLVGFVMLWFALDIWSSALVIVTTHRLVGATRERWGRVRIHEWMASGEARVPVWCSGRLIPWLGRWEWSREGQVPFLLRWAARPPRSSSWRRRVRVYRRLRSLTPEELSSIEAQIDALGRS